MDDEKVGIPGAAEWYVAHMPWPNEVMYHYTSRTAAEQILTTNTMWATDLRLMNDPRELRYGHDLIRQRVKHAIRRPRNPIQKKFLTAVYENFTRLIAQRSSSFSISLSSRVDLAHQWRDYADGGRGVALGWSIDSAIPGIPLRMWVLYDRAEQRRLIDGAMTFHLDWMRDAVLRLNQDPAKTFTRAGLSLAMFFDAIVQTFKSSKWKPEAEFRLVFQNFDGSDEALPVSTRNFRGVEKRYIDGFLLC